MSTLISCVSNMGHLNRTVYIVLYYSIGHTIDLHNYILLSVEINNTHKGKQI